ncbi:hypothetical protein FRB98_003587 [Tulasnella sp. 332]|nr:hypothetical protein FRB98_003587 [Tulasnella sp. 332]
MSLSMIPGLPPSIVATIEAAAAASKVNNTPNAQPTFVAPAPQPFPVPMPITMPSTFDDAPERAHVIMGVKAAIGNINEVIDVLNHPLPDNGDLTHISYGPDAVATFMIRSGECQHNLALASVTASAWSTAVEKMLRNVTDIASKVKDEINTTTQEIAKNTMLIESSTKTIADLTAHREHESQMLAEAQARYNQAKDQLLRARSMQQASNALMWIPIVATSLNLAETSMTENTINSAGAVIRATNAQVAQDQSLLAKTASELKDQQQNGIALHAAMTSLGANDRELIAQQNKLKDDSTYLGPLKVKLHSS